MFSMIQRDFGIINTFENLTTKKIKSLHWPTACRYFGERSNKTNRPKPINPSTLLEHPESRRNMKTIVYGCLGLFPFSNIYEVKNIDQYSQKVLQGLKSTLHMYNSIFRISQKESGCLDY